MMGEDISHYNITDTAGIIPRFSQELFKIIEGSEEYSHTKVEISYFEIYNEKIHDLLGPSQNGRSAPLRVREHPELGPYVVDLTVHNVHSFETLQVPIYWFYSLFLVGILLYYDPRNNVFAFFDDSCFIWLNILFKYGHLLWQYCELLAVK